MLRLMDLDELIATDADDCVAIVTRLGQSADLRADLRGRIAERKHRLYDDTAVVDEFASLLQEWAVRTAD